MYTFGLYSALRAWSAIVLRSSRQSKLTVATMFLQKEADRVKTRGTNTTRVHPSNAATLYLLQNRGYASHCVRILVFVTRSRCIDGCWCRWQSKWCSGILHWSWYGRCLHSRCSYGRCSNVETGHVDIKKCVKKKRKGKVPVIKRISTQWAPPFYTFRKHTGGLVHPAMMIAIFGPFQGFSELPLTTLWTNGMSPHFRPCFFLFLSHHPYLYS